MKIIFESVDNYTIESQHGNFLVDRVHSPEEILWLVTFPDESRVETVVPTFERALSVVQNEILACDLLGSMNLTVN